MSSSNPESWFLLISQPANAAVNMAVDEALLETMPALKTPVLRFYSWTEPAASFGYFQRYSDVETWTELRPLVRRPTGGGIVPHDCDWTYSLVFPAGHRWHSFRAIQSYRAVHEWVRDAFAELGVTASLAAAPNKSLPGRCFVGHEEADLLVGQNKLAGAAQRRTRSGLLIQGSIRASTSLARNDWHRAMCTVMERQSVSWSPLVPGADLQTRIKALAAKYESAQYNRKR
jgi:lipoyl(octanoyl) transferase